MINRSTISMSEIIIVSIVAFLAATLTFFSGFGLGTLLTPVMALFFPVQAAIALTAIVHFLHNLFKLVLMGRHADRVVIVRFGVPAVIAALLGAWLMTQIADAQPLIQYTLMGKSIAVTPLKCLIGLLLIFFALMDLLPYFQRWQFGREKLSLGGALSGFFGGLSGNQGALRSAFLVKAGLSKEAFIGTGVVIASLIDVSRLSVYASRMDGLALGDYRNLLICACLAAFAGAYLGSKLLKKVTLQWVQHTVAIMLICIAIGMIAGLV
jgi:uncharacterized protein